MANFGLKSHSFDMTVCACDTRCHLSMRDKIGVRLSVMEVVDHYVCLPTTISTSVDATSSLGVAIGMEEACNGMT